MYSSYPSSSYGYYRGSPVFRGEGAGQGGTVAGTTQFAAGQGALGALQNNGWSPTILYMFVLVFAEMFVFAYLARHI